MATSRLTARNVINSAINSATGTGIETGLQKAAAANASYLQQAQELYEPYKQTGLSSLDEYTKLLLGGVDGLSNDQNYQALTKQAENTVMANRAVSGLLRSGSTANTLDNTLLNFANTYYANRLNQLQSGVSYGTMAADSQNSILQKLGTNQTDLATALANIQIQREGNATSLKAAQAQAEATKAAANTTAKAQQQAGITGAIGTIAAGVLGGLLRG